MIKLGSKILVSDNSGAKLLKCIGILSKNNNMFNACIGDIIICVVKLVSSKKSKVKVSDIVKAILIREKSCFHYKDGFYIKFKENSAVLIDNRNNLLGTRIFGLVSRYFKDKNFIKLSFLVTEFI